MTTHLEKTPAWMRQFDGALDAVSPYSYGAGEPAAGVVPFSGASKWNTKIPAEPAVAAESAAVVAWLNSLSGPSNRNLGTGGTAEDFDKPIFYSAAGDPLVRIKCASRPPNGTYTAAADIPVAARKAAVAHNKLIRVPALATPAGGTDGHMVIQSGSHTYELFRTGYKEVGEGRISCITAGLFDLTGDGTPTSFVAATASGCSAIAGPIRLCEMEAGVISHAIAISVKEVRRTKFRAPANGCATPMSTGAEGDAEDVKRPITGCRFQLNYSKAEIEALAVPAWKMTILQAMREYGLIVVDTGGSSWSLNFESGTMDTAQGKADRWIAWAKAQEITKEGGYYPLPIKSVVDWTKLRVVEV
jgi:hypothetical protein